MYEDAFVTGRNNDEFAPLVYRLENGEEIPVWNLTLQDGVAAALAYQVHGAQALPRTRGTDIRYVDSTARGYTIARFGAAEVKVEMVAMGDVTVPFEQAPCRQTPGIVPAAAMGSRRGTPSVRPGVYR